MILSRIKWDAVAIAVLILLVIALGFTVRLQSSSKALLTNQNEQLKQQKTSAEAITTNVLKTTSLFNDIAQATHEANQQSDAESDQRVVIIRQSVKGDACAKLPVPAVASGELRSHADKLRNSSSGANSGKSDR